MAFPIQRLWRVRQHEAFRRLVRERERCQKSFLGAWLGPGLFGLSGSSSCSSLFGSTNQRDKADPRSG
jgi:hypothetical protein